MSYVKQVVELFQKRHQTSEILSPADYQTIAEWEKEEIPIEVALNSINLFFDNLTPETEPNDISVNKLQSDIKKQFADWLKNSKGND
ncbi:hypothetical protein BH10ACI1_BH10ACI1_30960 [soil metagenome]